MFEGMEHGDLKALYVIGENPLDSEADRNRARRLLEGLDFLVVQDIVPTGTARTGRSPKIFANGMLSRPNTRLNHASASGRSGT